MIGGAFMSILLMLLAAASNAQDGSGVRKRADYVATLTASFRQADTNKDGVLDLAETTEAARKSMHVPALSAEDEAKFRSAIRYAFDQIDTNKDGRQSLDETLRIPLAHFDCLDANHDGEIPEVEAEANIDRCEAAARATQ
jgi:hypothetical protein